MKSLKNEFKKKSEIKKYWEKEVCGQRYAGFSNAQFYSTELENIRYGLEPWIPDFADFNTASGKKILEIGVGGGIDFLNWVRNGARAVGIDLTEKACFSTRQRLDINNTDPGNYDLFIGDAEHLSLKNNIFDIVYSYGVLHHTPHVGLALQESFRVLKSGGVFKTMLYHIPSWTGWMLWFRYYFLKGKFLKTAKDAIFEYLESPGTSSFKEQDMINILRNTGFINIHINIRLGPSDLLAIKPSKKYDSFFYKTIWAFYPRWLIKLCGDKFGIVSLVQARKP